MRLFLMRLKCLILRIYRPFRWYYDSWCERKKLHPLSCTQKIDAEKYFILMPHADDEWIGCSTFIGDLSKDVTIIDTDMPGGDTTEMHQIRKDEVSKIASLYNRDIILLEGDKSKELYNILSNKKNVALLVPFFQDWHEEHIQVMRLLEQVLTMLDDNGYKLPIVVAYQVSLPIGDKYINLLHPMTKEEWKNKWMVFHQIYKSQQHISPTRFALNERINGALSNSYATEVFVVYQPKDWLRKINSMLLTEAMRHEFKSVLHSISAVRSLMRKI